MKLWWLLLQSYTYLPIPRRWQARPVELPRALYLLPLYGLLAGLICWAAARFVWMMAFTWTAALLLGISILLNGGVWLRDVMLLAAGRPPIMPPDNIRAALPINIPSQRPPAAFGHAALAVGCAYLLLQYLCFLLLLRAGFSAAESAVAAVLSRWIYLWGAYDFAALAPAFLHQGVSKTAFGRASVASLLTVSVCVAATPALLPALLPPALAALLFYRLRMGSLGALDEAAYGAAAAWSEILMYLSCLLFVH